MTPTPDPQPTMGEEFAELRDAIYSAYYSSREPRAEVTWPANDLFDLLAQVDALKAQVAGLEAERDELLGQYREANGAMRAMRDRADAAEARSARLETRIMVLEDDRDRKNMSLEAYRTAALAKPQPVASEEATVSGMVEVAPNFFVAKAAPTLDPAVAELVAGLIDRRNEFQSTADGGAYTDGIIVGLDDAVDILRSAGPASIVVELLASLKPFAEAAEAADHIGLRDNDDLWDTSAAMGLNAGHLRRAAALIAKYSPHGDEGKG